MTQHANVLLVFYVNGRRIEHENPDPELTLLQFLRKHLRLTGTKLGCAEGGCGACTVMVSHYDRTTNTIVHQTVNACLAPVCSMHGLAVTTVEGIGSVEKGLHPVQERLAKSHGSQCGFCTPGVVMSMYTLLRNNHQPSIGDMESAFEGNLCRCTGYRPILDGFRTFTKEFQCGMGDQCCRNNNNNNECEQINRNLVNGNQVNGDQVNSNQVNGDPVNSNLVNGYGEAGGERSTELATPSGCSPYDPTQETIFPSLLQLSDVLDTQNLAFSSGRVTWYRPTCLQELLNLKHLHPQAKLIVGNTEVGVEVKFKNMHYPVLVAVNRVPELLGVEHTEQGVTVGASTTLTSFRRVMLAAIDRYPEHKTRVFAAIVEMLRWFAGHQIRNVASLAGNIMTASPISDLNPLLMAAGCVLKLSSLEGGVRTLVMDEKFFTGYRRTAVAAEEVLISVTIPFTSEREYCEGYKQAQRKEDDIAIVNAGMRVRFKGETAVVEDMTLSFGGMAPITAMARTTMRGLVGKPWDESMLHQACQLLAEDLPLSAGAPGGMESYRSTLTTSFFFKFYLTVRLKLQQQQQQHTSSSLPHNYLSATKGPEREPSKGVQVYEEVYPGQPDEDSVGRPLPHVSALKQVSGEAVYVDDMPPIEGELYVGFVLSSKAHANIVSVDSSEARGMPGVLDYMDHTDIPGSNITGITAWDEEVFASKKVVAQGQVIGVIVANSQTEAQRAAKAVKVTYEELEPIITIEQAISAKSFFEPTPSIKNGDVDAAFTDCDHVIEGEVRTGAQEHFYLETVACIAVPGEDTEIEMFCSTQNPTQIQMLGATALGVPANRIVVRVKRMGGGFGGKETRCCLVSTPVILAAAKHKRPVRCALDRDEDIVMTGARHPFLARYKVGFRNDGTIQAAKVDFYSNCGYSLDLSFAVMHRALLHTDNCYRLPNVCLTGYLCKTNIASHTAFRGFGGPQGLFVCESFMTAIAEKLGVTPEKIREQNMYRDGDITHFNQVLENCNIERCWRQVVSNSRVADRRQQIQQFNRDNRWRKRGIAVVPVKFGISFTAVWMNQGGALVNIYTDGSVLITHGGTEMGQGLHTKVMQVASRAMKIPMSKIYISETSTAKVPNTSPSAASMCSDLYGTAVMYACQTLMKRLAPYMTASPKATWEEWVKMAYMDRVQLSTTGYFKVPDIGYDWETNSGNAFSYFTTGAACSEVEIDCLTGDHVVLRTDIVMDVGRSLNPGIDIGQIEGGFVQGYGMFTLEEHRFSPSGFIYTRGPGMYKIPGFSNIPVQMNVSLLKGASNPKAVYSSKAVGEPPLFLASSVFFAIKEAVAAARSEMGLPTSFRMDSPATAEKIRMNCEDRFTQQFPAAEPGSYKPWYVPL